MAAPSVVTDAAKYVARYSATLVGHSPWVDPGEAVSYVIFEWGRTTAYGNSTYYEQALPGEIYYHDITGLQEGTTYHFRLVGAARALRSYGADKSFTTTTVSPAPAPTPFMGWMVDQLVGISDLFYGIYSTVIEWVWPFWKAADFFYWLGSFFMDLALTFSDFSLWVDNIANKILTVLSFGDIYDYFKDLFDAALNAWDWVQNISTDIGSIIATWWEGTSTTVLGWIETAKNDLIFWTNWLYGQVVELREDVTYLLGQVPDVSGVLAWFSNWTGNVSSIIDNWWTSTVGGVVALINSAFTERESFWAGWQDWKDKVTEFFSDPEEWLYKAVDRIIERFW